MRPVFSLLPSGVFAAHPQFRTSGNCLILASSRNSTRETMPEIKPRFEFRIWADSLAPLRTELDAMGQAREAKSAETYLISKVTERCNAKIRAELMDIKLLVAEDRGLEQWKPILKAGFPLSQLDIANQVFPSLPIVAPTLVNSAYTYDEFLQGGVGGEPEV